MDRKDLSVVMLSIDPGLLKAAQEKSDVLERHVHYAQHVRSLDIVVFGGAKREKIIVSDKLTVHVTGAKGVSNFWRAQRIASSIISEKKSQLIITQDPHATGWIGYRIKKKHHIALLAHFHGDFWANTRWRGENWRHYIFDGMQKIVVAHADGIRVVSQAIADKLITSGVPQDKIRTINVPINKIFYEELSEKDKVRLEEMKYKYHDHSIVLFVGRLVAAKNLFFMIDVIKRAQLTVKNLLLIMVGDGDQREEIERYIEKNSMGTAVRLQGEKSQGDIKLYYHLPLLQLLVSTNESFGKVIIEAGMVGTTTLASHTTGASSIIVDGTTGYTVPINDLGSTADVLIEMIEYPEQTQQLGKNAKSLYRDTYSTEKTVEDMINFWLNLAKK